MVYFKLTSSLRNSSSHCCNFSHTL